MEVVEVVETPAQSKPLRKRVEAPTTEPVEGAAALSAPGAESNAAQSGSGPKSDPLLLKRQYRVKVGAVRHLHVGDSHLRENHHVPELYRKKRAEGLTDPRFNEIERKDEWEKKGRKGEESNWSKGFIFDSEYLAQLTDLIEECRGKATAIVVSLGTNDLRESPTPMTLEGLLVNFEDLFKKIRECPGVVMYVIAPIPCSTPEVCHLRDELDSRLWALIQTYYRETGGRVLSVSLTRPDHSILPREEGGPFDPQYWEKDGIHLNRAGAKLLTDELVRVQRNTPPALFLIDPEAREEKNTPPTKPPRAKGAADHGKGTSKSAQAQKGPKGGKKSEAKLPTGQSERREKGPGQTPRGVADEHGKGGKEQKFLKKKMDARERLKELRAKGKGQQGRGNPPPTCRDQRQLPPPPPPPQIGGPSARRRPSYPSYWGPPQGEHGHQCTNQDCFEARRAQPGQPHWHTCDRSDCYNLDPPQ